MEISGGYTAEVWGNTTGGLKQGAVYTGLLDFGATVDLEKLVGWKGASVSTTWLWLSGRDASEDLVGNFLTISNIAGFNTLRMLELWFQQDFFLRQERRRRVFPFGLDSLQPTVSLSFPTMALFSRMALLDGRPFCTPTFPRVVRAIRWALSAYESPQILGNG